MATPRFTAHAGRAALAVAAALLAGCPSSPPSGRPPGPEATISAVPPAPSETATAPAAAPQMASSQAQPASSSSWNIQYIGGPTGWTKAPADGETLLSLSGPPGGPLTFEVRSVPGVVDGAGLEKWVKARFDPATYQAVTPPVSETVVLGNAKTRALAFFTGQGPLTRTEWCVALWPVS